MNGMIFPMLSVTLAATASIAIPGATWGIAIFQIHTAATIKRPSKKRHLLVVPCTVITWPGAKLPADAKTSSFNTGFDVLMILTS